MRKATPDRKTSIEATDVDGESGGGAHFVTAARVKQAGDVLFLVVGQVSGERLGQNLQAESARFCRELGS